MHILFPFLIPDIYLLQYFIFVAAEKLLEDLKGIMKNGDYSDVTVSVRGTKFQLHRNILAARNAVFKLMFSNESQGTAPSTMSIDICDPDQFRTLIQYIYTGTADNLHPENVCGLYEVAIVYQEQQMKTECLQYMMNNLSVGNVCDYIAFAQKHELKELLEKATELFMRKVKEIVRQAKWKEFLDKYPEQAKEMYFTAVEDDEK